MARVLRGLPSFAGRLMRAPGRGPERRTTPARRWLSPDVVGQPARHRRESWESSPAGFVCPDRRASLGFHPGSLGPPTRWDFEAPAESQTPAEPAGSNAIAPDRSRLEVVDLQVFRGRSPPNRGFLKIVVSPVRVRVSPSVMCLQMSHFRAHSDDPQ